MTDTTAETSTFPTQTEAIEWAGFVLDDFGGSRVGRIHGVFVDADSGVPSWLIVAPGKRRAKKVVVPLRDCAAAAGRVWAAHGGKVMGEAPTVDPTRPLLREHELTICAHYGIGERVGRAAEVVARAQGSITSRPPTR
jgi:hypothetical protein